LTEESRLAGKIAGALFERRHRNVAGFLPLHCAAPLKVAEEKDLVFLDGAAESSAVLVLVVLRTSGIEEPARVERGVAEEFE